MKEAHTSEALFLDSLPAGTAATVRGVAVLPQDNGASRRRLLALGFTPGTRITVLCRAPGGDPAIYALRGYRIILRAVLAHAVLTDVITGNDS